ncbi:hypothetical protein AURDEDRAFT_172867 [Auricularia subglabra TFB-10046 SS5]|uniref:Uncharacterized protein n=1 Tax=Auricularia subglabra (strain TFB-10046 / SS5) TaxID=717982 RepID=J0DBP1_AURST|nr:hypothetical protein AURDEDRAFT_172867 [Auricularia subglabra TFB-10046 SS5]
MTQSAVRRMFIDDEAVEGRSDDEYEATEPEEDDGGHYVEPSAVPAATRDGKVRARPTKLVRVQESYDLTAGSSPRLASPDKRAHAPPQGGLRSAVLAGIISSSNEPNCTMSGSSGVRDLCTPQPDAPSADNTRDHAQVPRNDGVGSKREAVPLAGDRKVAEMAERLKPALRSLVHLLTETPDLLEMLDLMDERSTMNAASAEAGPSTAVSAGPIVVDTRDGRSEHVDSTDDRTKPSASVNTRPVDASNSGAPSASTSTAAPAAATSAAAPAKPDDSKFDGTKNCLDHDLWAPVLAGMYRKIRPPPRLVHYLTRGNPKGVQAASFLKWSKHERLGFMKDVLGMACTNQYVNISRMPYRNMRVETGGSVSYPLNYLTRRGTAEPALFVSLVEIKKCSLLSPDRIKRRDGSGYLEKKGIIANLFQQEFELMICNLGCIYNVDSITLPSWSTKAEELGLTFHTKVTACQDDDVVYASPSKPGLFDPSPASSKTRFPVQLVGAHRVPMFDASVDGFDIHQPFADLKELPNMEQEATPGSVGVVFYTISDAGGPSRIEFNIHGFALVAEPTLDWPDSS